MVIADSLDWRGGDNAPSHRVNYGFERFKQVLAVRALPLPSALHKPVRPALHRDFAHSVTGRDAMLKMPRRISLLGRVGAQPPHGFGNNVGG